MISTNRISKPSEEMEAISLDGIEMGHRMAVPPPLLFLLQRKTLKMPLADSSLVEKFVSVIQVSVRKQIEFGLSM
jgi:hypothetical protein